jgi:hypothetical protein
MIPPENTLVNISGKMVIISNLIQVQKTLGGVDPDASSRRVDLIADLPGQGDKDLLLTMADDQQAALAYGDHGLDLTQVSAVAGQHSAAEELAGIVRAFFRRPETIGGDIQLLAGQSFSLNLTVDALDFEDVAVPPGPEGFDRKFLDFLPPPHLDGSNGSQAHSGIKPDLELPLLPLGPLDPADSLKLNFFQ